MLAGTAYWWSGSVCSAVRHRVDLLHSCPPSPPTTPPHTFRPLPHPSCPAAALQQRLVASLREYRMLHMRGTPGGMGGGLSPNALVLPERLKSMPLLTLGEPGWSAGVGGSC